MPMPDIDGYHDLGIVFIHLDVSTFWFAPLFRTVSCSLLQHDRKYDDRALCDVVNSIIIDI